MKKYCWFLIACVVLAITFSTCSKADASDDLGFSKTFKGEKYGTVTFNHLSHLKADCVGCHTEMKAAEGVTKDFGHNFCKSCHKANDGPTKCKDCHVK